MCAARARRAFEAFFALGKKIDSRWRRRRGSLIPRESDDEKFLVSDGREREDYGGGLTQVDFRDGSWVTNCGVVMSQ